MAAHSSVLAWRIPGTGEPGGLPSLGVTQSWTRLKRLSSSKHGEGGKNGDYLFKKLCCLGVSREIRDTDRGNLWSQGYFFSLIFN